MDDYISRADAIEAVSDAITEERSVLNCGLDMAIKIIKALPSADAVSREMYDTVCEEYNKLVHKAICGLCDENCEYERGNTCYKAREHNAIESLLPSAEAVDCTDFVNWLTDAVMDEEYWELNAVAYGEIICRKLVKLGVLEVTEEPSYYIRPSAEAVQETVPTVVRVTMSDGSQYYLEHERDAIQADAVQGEWIDEDGNNVPLHKDGYPLRSCYCNQCHEWLVASDEYEVKGNFCPNCGARMKGGAE